MPKLSIRGINQAVAAVQDTLENLARNKSLEEGLAAYAQIRGLLGQINASLAEQKSSPADLTGPSQRAVLWLEWLSNSDHLAQHLDTLAQAIRAAGSQHVSVRLYASSNLVQARPVRGRMELVINQGFAGAPADVVQALVEAVLSRKKHSDLRKAREYAHGPDFLAIQARLRISAPARSHADGQGRYFQLEEVFWRVSRAYFAGQIGMPRLTWSRSPTRRKFGHYDFSSDTLMVSRSLDQPGVPAYVLDAIMYHELLHKQMGVTVVNGRRYTHTPEFHKAERQFAQFAEAEAYLKGLASRRKPTRRRRASRRG